MTQEQHDFKENELIPSMFEALDRAFPEMDFRRKGNKWESKCHLDGTKDRQGKAITVVYEDSKYCAKDLAREENKGIIDLYMEHNGLAFWDAMEALAKTYCLNFPRENRQEWEAQERIYQARERAKDTFKAALWNGSQEAQEVLDYLHGRKWTDGEIKAAELGLITPEVRSTLPDGEKYKGWYQVGDKWMDGVEQRTHTLVIPYRSGSRLLGFKFREPRRDLRTGQKYTNTKGLEKNKGFFGIGIGITDLTIVEGELDALHAQVKGGRNVVAITGKAIAQGQLDDAIRRARNHTLERITLLLDGDEAGQGEVLHNLDILEPTGAEVYVAALPDGEGKDTDEYLGEHAHTIEEWQALVDNESLPSYLYRYKVMADEYVGLAEAQGKVLNDKQRSEYLNKVTKILTAPYFKPQNAPRIYAYLEMNAQALEVDVDGLKAYISQAYERSQAKNRRDEAIKASKAIQELIGQGRIDEALEKMRTTAAQQNLQDKAVQFEKAFATMEPQQWEKYLSETRDGIPTGYKFSQGNHTEPLTLNPGLTFVCGYRGHGKTSFLNNIALNEAKRNIQLGNGKSVLYFSYEVDKRRLATDLLNTFVNDPGISHHPADTILSYFKGKGAQYFKDGESGDHYKDFLTKKNVFLSQYLNGPLVIVEENYKVEELLKAIRYYLSKHKVSIVCLDYAQLIYSEEYARQRTEEIKKVVNDIKDFANKANLPFVLAAQFNRDVNSPVSVDTKNIGEGGDFERIADTCIGLFNLKELHPVVKPAGEESEAKKLLKKMGFYQGLTDTEIELKPIEGKLFVRLMKRRYGYYPLDTILEWNGLTKFIKPNDPQALDIATQNVFFDGEGEGELSAF